LFSNIKEFAASAVKEAFQMHKESQLLDHLGRQKFHMIVAKVLYLVKCAQPDILMGTSFLCARVKQPTKNICYKTLQI